MVDYILFICQDQYKTKSMLIHANNFLVYQKFYHDALTQNFEPLIRNDIDLNKCLIQYVSKNGDYVLHEHSVVCYMLSNYAGGNTSLYDVNDRYWIEKSIILPELTNPITTYNEYSKIKEYNGENVNIIDCILVLEKLIN